MPLLVSVCTGFGGLLLQLVWLRRFGAILGNTAATASLVLGVFLCGLGLGSLWAARRAPRLRRPATFAAVAYGLVAACGFLADPLLIALDGRGAAAAAVLLLAPGLPAVAMGMAFSLLFALLPTGDRTGAARLHSANLMGAVLGTWLGSNLLIPELGGRLSAALGASAYVLAGLLLAARARGERPALRAALPLPAAPVLPRGAVALAVATGVLLLGFEVFLLRRLPFHLDGFQPTLSGVVTAVLLCSAAGAALAPCWARRAGAQAPALALALAILACSVGAQEWLVPHLARVSIDSTAWLHLRVLLSAGAVVLLPCLLLGAVVPLQLAPYLHPQTRGAVAGVLFAALGCGELLGALLVGQLLPRLVPQAYFAVTPLLLGLAATALLWRAQRLLALGLVVPVALLALLGVSGAGSPLSPQPPVAGSRYDRGRDYRHLAHAVDGVLTASVAYNRRNHSLLLFTDEFRATETGPNTAYMRALGHLPFLLRDDLAHAAVIAYGTGITADAVLAWPTPRQVDVVEISPAVLSLATWFTADGPVPDGVAPLYRRDGRAREHVGDGRAFVACAAPGSLDLVTMEPLLPYAPGTVPLYTAEFYGHARRALSERGLLLQWIPSHAMPRAMFASLLHTFAQSFPFTSVWLVDHSTLLVGSRQPHAPASADLARRLAAAPPKVRDALHECGLCHLDDLHAALLSAQAPPVARVLHDDVPFLERVGYWSGATRLRFLPDNLLYLAELVAREPPGRQRDLRMKRLSGLRSLALAALPDPGESALPQAVLELDAARALAEHSVLLHREQGRALRALYENRIASAATVAEASAVADLLLGRDASSALAFAARAAAQTDTKLQRELWGAAIACDPILPFATPPVLLQNMPRSLPLQSPREDLGRLPDGAELAAECVGSGARAYALRATFAPRAARALVARAGERALLAAESAALAPLLDPATFSRYAAAVQARGGAVASEVVPLWRRDLPLTPELAALADGDVAARTTLAQALLGRRDAAACASLAGLLTDPDLAVRSKAAQALQRLAAGRIAYDPQGDESQWRAAAEAVRRLHNPPP